MPRLSFAVLFLASTPLLLAEVPDELQLEPLSLTVSKLERDNFGKGVVPFNSVMQRGISGTNVLAKINKPRGFKASLLKEGAKLTSLEDDKGTDLTKLPGGGKLDQFWEENKPLTILTSRESTGPIGLRIRGAGTPAAGATKIIAKGTLTFAMTGQLQQEDHEDVVLQDGETLKNKAGEFKISKGKAGFEDRAAWWIQVRPGPEATNVQLEVFGKDKEDLLIDTDGGKRGAWQSSNGIASYGFPFKGEKLHKVVIHFSPKGDKVQVPFTLETGLGGFQADEE